MTSLSDEFQIGDVVTWKSQARGSITKKTGKIFRVVKPGERMDKAKAQSALSAQYCDLATWAADFGGMTRREQSYLVVVPGTYKRLPRVYWPRSSALLLAEAN
jgi:hypothetical protein